MTDGQLPGFLADKTILRSYAEITEVLKSRFFVTTRADDPPEAAPFRTNVLTAIDGDPHFRRRRIESRLFTNEALQYLETVALAPIIGAELAQLAGPGRGVVRTELRALLLRVLHRVAAAVTGIDGVTTGAQVALFNQLIDEIQAGNAVSFARDGQAAQVSRALAAREEFRRQFFGPSLRRRQELVAQHQAGQLPADQLPRDLLTLLLLEWDPEWDADLPLREVTLYLSASTRTMIRLALHVVDHLACWVRDHPEDRPRCQDALFLRRAAAEALRLHAALPAVVRRATNDVTLSSGRLVRAGETVGLVLTGSNRQQAWFGDNPDEFDPYRQERMPAGVPPWGTAFGGGAHMCIGRRMVTGGDWFAGSDRADRGLNGALIIILLALYRAGIEPDPAQPPEHDTATYYDAYSRYPVILTRLPAGGKEPIDEGDGQPGL
jgi:cytochrome P450